eukprot:1187283-Prorocentrum_minimum.AAC.3
MHLNVIPKNKNRSADWSPAAAHRPIRRARCTARVVVECTRRARRLALFAGVFQAAGSGVPSERVLWRVGGGSGDGPVGTGKYSGEELNSPVVVFVPPVS